MIQAACTIASLNYLPYVRTLCRSYLELHPENKFYYLLVDRLPPEIDLSDEPFELVLVEDLGIQNFQSIAFKFDVVEFNTSVKPTFLKKLLASGIDRLIYFDPDICLFSRVDFIYELLQQHSIVLTPHATSPNQDSPLAESRLLFSGAFNLGFIAVSRTSEAEQFLSWWEDRCLTFGFAERRSGLYVDQKWINFVPCFYASTFILRDPGCNVAYWNLHERHLEAQNGSWIVNGEHPLVFYHFSGIRVDGGDSISKGLEQYTLATRPDLTAIFASYRKHLTDNGIRTFALHKYAYGYFSNGELVNKLQRALFSVNMDAFAGTNPFDAKGPFHAWAARNRLLSTQESAGKHNAITYDRSDSKVRIVNAFLRLALRMLGADRYTVLMKYFSYVSELRNQKDLFLIEPESRRN